MEPTTNGEFTRRMSGLAHSNTLGQYSGLTLAVGVVLYHFYGQRSTYRIIIMGLAAAALVASLSRTSLVATVVALIFAYRDRFSISSRNVGIGLAAAIVGLVGLMFMSTQVDFGDLLAQKMTAVSKSGDAEELTSATGRSQIWAYSIKLIMDQPLTGYGATTSKYFLSEYSMYTHNLVLNIAFSTGIFGGLIGLVMVLQQALGLVFHRHRITNAIVAFVLVNGLFENLIFSILAGMPTMIWVMALAWKQVADINGGEHGVRAMSLKERLA
jgi:O-antigen ligase